MEAQRLIYRTTLRSPLSPFKDEEMNGQMHEFLTAFWIGLIIEITWVLIKSQIPGLPTASSNPRDSVSRFLSAPVLECIQKTLFMRF